MNFQTIQKLQKLGKDFFTIAELQKIFKQRKPSLYVTLNRLVRNGWFTRIKTGIYQLTVSSTNLERIANQIYYPSYLSFESALAKYGIISQIPYTLTFATSKRTKHIAIKETQVVFSQLKKELFFGYKLSGGIYLAEKEKALLDLLYLISRGKNSFNLQEINIKEISRSKLLLFSRKFPKATRELINKLPR
jgi:predicted transcriptional regulator of viral defense system